MDHGRQLNWGERGGRIGNFVAAEAAAGAWAAARWSSATPITNPFNGPVSKPVNVVNPNGNVIRVPQGHQLTGSPNGQFLQLRGPTGSPTGLRLDGSHTNVPFNHAHVPGVGDHIPVP